MKKRSKIAVLLAAALVGTCVPQVSPAGPEPLVAEAHRGQSNQHSLL